MIRKPLFLACLVLAFPMLGQTAKLQGTPKRFVQAFYDWYVPIANRRSRVAPVEIALKEQGSMFSPQLAEALSADRLAQKQTPGELVSLDYDPILNSQDPDDKYSVGETRQKGQTYWVSVYGAGTQAQGKPKSPDVIAEVEQRDGQWVFVNFHSPSGGALLDNLKTLAKRRKRPHQ
jgi:hypothetical protein